MDFRGKKGRDRYHYDEETHIVTDKEGNSIKLYEDLEGLTDGSKKVVLEWIDLTFKKLYVEQNEVKKLTQYLKENKML